MFSIHNYQHIASLVPPLLSLNQVAHVPVAEYSAICAQASKHIWKQKDGTEQGDTNAITVNNAASSGESTHVAPTPVFEKRKKQMSSNPQKSTTGSHQQDKSNQSNQHDVASSLNADEAQTSLPIVENGPPAHYIT